MLTAMDSRLYAYRDLIAVGIRTGPTRQVLNFAFVDRSSWVHKSKFSMDELDLHRFEAVERSSRDHGVEI